MSPRGAEPAAAADDARSAFSSVEAVQEAFAAHDYIADRPLALTMVLAADLEKPVLLEGEAGVGKTDVAKVVAAILETPLIRLQCYEGLDVASALYEWNYARQILHIRMAEHDPGLRRSLQASIFGDEFLLSRPLLQAIRHPGPRPAVLLIDEVDRADEEFEAFLLEVLSEFQVTVPELGTFRSVVTPFVVLTSNRTRELNDALKRRCLYLWIDYPSLDKERQILLRRIPAIEPALAEQMARAMQALRRTDFYKRPGVAETLDWARALMRLGVGRLDARMVEETAGCFLKYHDDIELLRATGARRLLEESGAGEAALPTGGKP